MAATGACASIVEGTTQSVTVLTERAGQTVGVVNPTPGSVLVGKSKDPINLLCTREGFEESSMPLPSEFQGMTFGNILFGGIVGVAIDAGSGAMNKYAPSVTVILIPSQFASIAARDTFYSRLNADVLSVSTREIAEVRKNCAGDVAATCDAKVKAAEAKRDAEVKALELKRSNAKIQG